MKKAPLGLFSWLDSARDFARFHVIALLLSFSHGEGFAGQDAIQDDAAEQIFLGGVGQQEAHVARVLR